MKNHWNQYLTALGRTLTPISSSTETQPTTLDSKKRYNDLSLNWNGVSSSHAFDLKGSLFKETSFSNELK
jgi:hypothetical protein